VFKFNQYLQIEQRGFWKKIFEILEPDEIPLGSFQDFSKLPPLENKIAF